MLNDTVPEATAADEKPTQLPDEKKDEKGSALWREVKGLSGCSSPSLRFHSLVAKPFYIPSESMMPGLLTGDRLVVTKYPYGWSWVSPELPHHRADARAACSAISPSAAISSSSLRRGRAPIISSG